MSEKAIQEDRVAVRIGGVVKKISAVSLFVRFERLFFVICLKGFKELQLYLFVEFNAGDLTLPVRAKDPDRATQKGR